ncbi:MAG: cobalt ECF transporter T component CbiQ [Methanospirillaceae archaeon]|nr:cobalt ECF transporter T component CbiQ [Methanospirillaceae archaeon]
MIEELFDLEEVTNLNSYLHSLDARVKLIVFLAVIVAMVGVPYSPVVYEVAAVFFLFFVFFWISSTIPVKVYIHRLIFALPFGFLISGVQIFFTNKYYTEYHTLVTLPFGITIFAESVQFASILLLKFFICYSYIVLLSSTTTLQDLLEAAGRMKVPAELILSLGMMIRYLFVFGAMYCKVIDSLQTRLFNPFDRSLPYKYRISNMGYMMGSMFIRALEQGERTYVSMQCRGYGRDSFIYIKEKDLLFHEWFFLSVCLCVIVIVPVICWYYPGIW